MDMAKAGTGWRLSEPEEIRVASAETDESQDSEQSVAPEDAVNAAANGDWAKVRALLESGACDADETDAQGETVVAWAVRWGTSIAAIASLLLYQQVLTGYVLDGATDRLGSRTRPIPVWTTVPSRRTIERHRVGLDSLFGWP